MPPIIETRQLHHLYSAGTPFEHPALNGVDRVHSLPPACP